MAHINTRNLYLRRLQQGHGPVISMYSQDKELNIVEDKLWHDPNHFDFFSYGTSYDFTLPFFTQFHALWKRVPLPHLQRAYSSLENSEYCNAVADLKNCYLMINADYNESCSYGFSVEDSKFCVDLSISNKCELCYQVTNLRNCYHCLFCDNCENCSNLHWCKDCVGCTDCFGCIGLRHKHYHVNNEPVTKEEYERVVKKYDTKSYKAQMQAQHECEQFFVKHPRKYMHGSSNENVEGDYIYQSKDVKESFLVKKAEHCKYAHFIDHTTNTTNHAYDYTMFGVGADYIYECAWCGLNVNNLKFCLWNYGASDMEYCIGCHYSKHLFGCMGLQHKQYCILNQQYTKEEYEALIPRIKKHMMDIPYIDRRGSIYRYGEFFPSELSPFDYNQTLAREFMPLSKEEVIAQSMTWHEMQERPPLHSMHPDELPESIDMIDDHTLTTPILCKSYLDDPSKALEHHCTQYFKIIPQEREFYRSMGLAVPRHCPNSRHFHRLQRLNPFHLWTRSCQQCGITLRTSYAPERPEIVWCENCYVRNIYGGN